MTARLVPDYYLRGARDRLTQAGVAGLDADYAIVAVALANRTAWRFENHGRVDLDKTDIAFSLAFPEMVGKGLHIEAPLDAVVRFLLRQCVTEGGMDFSPNVSKALKEWARRKSGDEAQGHAQGG